MLYLVGCLYYCLNEILFITLNMAQYLNCQRNSQRTMNVHWVPPVSPSLRLKVNISTSFNKSQIFSSVTRINWLLPCIQFYDLFIPIPIYPSSSAISIRSFPRNVRRKCMPLLFSSFLPYVLPIFSWCYLVLIFI